MTDYNSLEEAFNRLALMTERDALAQQLAASEEDCAAWKSTAETFEDFYRKTEAELDTRDKRLAEAKGLLNLAQHHDIDPYLDREISAFLTNIEQDKENG